MSRAKPETSVLGTDFATPVGQRYFEDYRQDAVYEYGYRTVDADEIVQFARCFDPNPLHVDPDFAARGPFGGLIASGWHSVSLLSRLMVDHYVSSVASLASSGADEVRWSAPLRPGDTLRARASIVEARPSRSKPDRGLVTVKAVLLNQRDEAVVSLVGVNILRRRPHA